MQKQWTRWAFSIVLLLLISHVANAEWYKDYDAAMNSIRRGDWAGAIPKLQSAIAGKNEEGMNIRTYGMNFLNYFPHCYLGMAYFNQNNLQAALAEFERSEKSGAIRQDRELYRRMTGLKTVALARLASAPEANRQSVPALQVPVNPVGPSADQNSSSARPAEPEAVKPQDLSSTNTVKPLETEKRVIQPPVDNAAHKSEAYMNALKAGARKYFEGNYAEAVRTLNSAARLDPTEPSAHFLLGCAYASQYLLTGRQDDSMLSRATSAFKKTRSLDPNYRVMNNSYISPAVLKIYEES
jgi:tetratricopeptide (TPR) repeat protein